MMNRTWKYAFPAAALVLLGSMYLPAQSDGPSNFRARLAGGNEVPAVSSKGGGEFRATLQNNNSEIAYELTYTDLSGTASAAHLHFGQSFATGGVVVHLCGSGGTPLCPTGPSGTVKGSFGASRVGDVALQGIAAGELGEFLDAMRAGHVYVNVHTAAHPNGEIRGQLRRGRGVNGDDDDDDDGEGKGKGKGDEKRKGKGGE